MAVKWFAVKTFYRSRAEDRPVQPDRFYDPDTTLIEERTLLIKAKSRAEAKTKAEREAQDYAQKTVCVNPYQQNILTEYMGYCDVYELAGNPADKLEIFSATRLMSHRISNNKIARIYIGKRERHLAKSKHKKFINKDYSSEIN